jgi:hypothetical protein
MENNWGKICVDMKRRLKILKWGGGEGEEEKGNEIFLNQVQLCGTW